MKNMVALSDYAKTRAEDEEMQLTLEVALMRESDEPPAPDKRSIEDRCAGVVKRRVDEAAEFSPLTRSPYNRR